MRDRASLRFLLFYPTLNVVIERCPRWIPIFFGALLCAHAAPAIGRAQSELVCQADFSYLPARSLSAPPAYASAPSPYASAPSAHASAPPPYAEALASVASPAKNTQLDTASRHWQQFDALLIDGRYDEALIGLAFIEERFPSLEDHIRYRRALVEMHKGNFRQACTAFSALSGSTIDSALRTLSDVAEVRCAFRAGRRDAETKFRKLRNQYPALPEVLALELERGQMYARTKRSRQAVKVFRTIDLEHPGSPFAAQARDQLQMMSDRGVRVPSYTIAERVDRAERLVSQGPMDLARVEVADLLEGGKLDKSQKARVHLAAARIARVEGRWDEVQRHHKLVRGADTKALNEREVERAEAAAAAADAREKDAARAEIRSLGGGASNWVSLPPYKTVKIIEVAARADLKDEVNRALEAVRDSNRFGPANKYEAALLAIGTGDDTLLTEILGPLTGTRRLEPGASYHFARALERLERWNEAEQAFQRVVQTDQTETGYYAMWSRLRLDVVAAARHGHSPPPPISRPQVAAFGSSSSAGSALGSPTKRASKTASIELSPSSIRETLEALSEEHGDAYPWFERAADFFVLGDTDLAANELHEAYLAWRFAVGRPLLRAGIEAVYRGKSRRKEFLPRKLRRARAKLTFAQRQAVADIAHVLGDEGTAAGFGGWNRVQARPRAYSKLVARVAEQNGLDPNLLFAVMRVESVYQRRIVSHAGAVGLMQIMPRTGRLIADQLGYHDFTAADLLDPEINLTFAAWYLASLIERFDGRLPLAIASYNGGPHNVRRWLSMHGEDMPLDAFLEQIPFTETHRYVRRVTTHYQEYRSQLGLGMEQFPMRLPPPRIDLVAF